MRKREGAEKDALRAIELCIKNGFSVKVQTNVNRKNLDSMLKTMELFDKMGVGETRIIRTTEAPRWVQNAGDATLTMPRSNCGKSMLRPSIRWRSRYGSSAN